MNIEIVNKQVANKLQMKESDVSLINKFFWSHVKDAVYTYTPNPININNVCVIYPTAYHTKKQLYYYINGIRKLRRSNRYKPDSAMRIKRIEEFKTYIRKIWAIRKQNQWTN